MSTAVTGFVFTGDFNKAFERELLAGDPNGQRRLSSTGNGLQSRQHPVADTRRVAFVVRGSLTVIAFFCAPRPAVPVVDHAPRLH